MASKRNMYRPAQVQENVGRPKQRKTITQGRLITNGGPQGTVPAPGTKKTGGLLSQGHLNSSHASNTSANRSLLQTSHNSNISMNNSQLHHSSLVQGRLEESLFSPRQQVPYVSEAITPNRGPPMGSLDLTDSEAGDETSETRSWYQKPEEVLCVDAARQTTNPNVSEVDIRIGADRSPVKIVCHSPSPLQHTQRQETPQTAIEPDEENLRQSKHRQPVIIKEKLTDDHIEPRTAVQSIPMSPSSLPASADRRVLQSLPNTYPQHNALSDPREAELGYSDRTEEHADIAIDNEGTIKKQQKPTSAKTAASAKKEKRPETAKKKNTRVVPSRYMQAANTKAKASLSARMEKSSMNNSGKNSRSMDCPPSAKKSVRKTVPMNRQEKRREMARPSTPDSVVSETSSTGGKTSTPTRDLSSFSLMDIDASAIHPEVSMLAGSGNTGQHSRHGKGRARVPGDLKDDLMGQSIISNASICNQSTLSSKPKQKRDMKDLQRHLDMTYMHNLQWAFLEAQAKKTLHDQEKQAISQIYGLYEKLEGLKKSVVEKEQQYARLKHTNMTDHLVDVQRQCLIQVVDSLPQLQKHYSSLAYALDTTRHQIPTADIYLPQNEDEFQAELTAQLLESERLLEGITSETRESTRDIAAMGNAMVTMDQAVEMMETELKKGQELLAATEALTIQECCLRTQEIQARQIGHT